MGGRRGLTFAAALTLALLTARSGAPARRADEPVMVRTTFSPECAFAREASSQPKQSGVTTICSTITGNRTPGPASRLWRQSHTAPRAVLGKHRS